MKLSPNDCQYPIDPNVVRVFKGSETQQVCGITGSAADPEQWYFEPADYEGDVLWSTSWDTRNEAEAAAHKWQLSQKNWVQDHHLSQHSRSR